MIKNIFASFINNVLNESVNALTSDKVDDIHKLLNGDELFAQLSKEFTPKSLLKFAEELDVEYNDFSLIKFCNVFNSHINNENVKIIIGREYSVVIYVSALPDVVERMKLIAKKTNANECDIKDTPKGKFVRFWWD
jgi:hypothetical protein